MSRLRTPLRVVQWTTGNVARQTLPAVLRRPDLELVGVYAWSAAKVGVDAAELVGLDTPVGVAATDDVDELLASRPDCVVYTPLHLDVDEVARLLLAGVNVVTTAEFLTGAFQGEAARQRLQEAAVSGGVSLFGSGMNPGYAQLLAAVSTGICREVRHVRVLESVDVSLFAGDSNMDELGWGRPLGEPDHPAAVERAVGVFKDGVEVLAELLGVELDEITTTVEFAAATADLDLPGRPIARGTVAGIDLRFGGVAFGREVIELHQRWVMSSRIEPAWTVEHGYRVEVDGSPQVSVAFTIMPDQDLSTLTTADLHAIGMTITGLPVVDAIPAVVAAAPGIVTYADLPVITTPVVG